MTRPGRASGTGAMRDTRQRLLWQSAPWLRASKAALLGWVPDEAGGDHAQAARAAADLDARVHAAGAHDERHQHVELHHRIDEVAEAQGPADDRKGAVGEHDGGGTGEVVDESQAVGEQHPPKRVAA